MRNFKSKNNHSDKINKIILELSKEKNKNTTTDWHVKEAINKLKSAVNYLYYASIE